MEDGPSDTAGGFSASAGSRPLSLLENSMIPPPLTTDSGGLEGVLPAAQAPKESKIDRVKRILTAFFTKGLHSAAGTGFDVEYQVFHYCNFLQIRGQ